MSFKFLPRSAVFGVDPTEGRAGLPARPGLRAVARRPAAVPRVPMAAPRAPTASMPAQAVTRIQQLQAALIQQRQITQKAVRQLGAYAARVRQLEQQLRVGYSPDVQQPSAPGTAVDVGVPTRALRNPYLETSDGGRGAPPAVPVNASAGAPGTAAHAPGDRASDARATVRAAEDAIFYGDAEAAFYEGDEED